MKNKLVDLNNHLFEMIERLNDENLTNEDLQKEIGRATAMSNISKQIIDNAKVELDAAKLVMEYGGADRRNIKLPTMLEYGEKKN